MNSSSVCDLATGKLLEDKRVTTQQWLLGWQRAGSLGLPLDPGVTAPNYLPLGYSFPQHKTSMISPLTFFFLKLFILYWSIAN